MTLQEFQLTMDALDGQPLAMQLDVHRPGPGTLPGRRKETFGVLCRRHPCQWEELWWTLPKAAHFALIPHHNWIVPESAFVDAWWDDATFVIHRSAYDTRLTLLKPANDPSGTVLADER